MSKIKNYLWDVEEAVVEAIENNFTSLDDVVAFVQTKMSASKHDIQAVLELLSLENM
jgi:hypothetical protein